MNMNDKPFADWSWKNKQQSAPMQNTLAPLGSGAMEQAAPNMNAAPMQDPTLQALDSYATSKGIEAGAGVVEGALGGSTAPLGTATLGTSAANTLAAEGMAGAIGSGAATGAGSQAAMLAAQNAGFGAAAPLAAAETATALGAGTLGTAGAATGAAATGAGAGATAALAAMGPVGWAGLGLMGAKAMGLFNDGTTKVGYQEGTSQVQGYQSGTNNVLARMFAGQGKNVGNTPALKPEDYLSARNVMQGVDTQGTPWITNDTSGYTTTKEDKLAKPSKGSSGTTVNPFIAIFGNK
jgi:hypothetical protein